MPPSTILHLGHIVVVLRRSPATVEHQDRHHAVVLRELLPVSLLDRSSGCVIELYVFQELGGAGVMVLGSVGSGRRTTTSSMLCQHFHCQSMRVRRQHSPLSLLCITMILHVRRNFFEMTTFPNINFCLESFGSKHSCHNKDKYIENYVR